MAESNTSGNTGKGTKDKSSQGNTEKEVRKTTSEIFANYVAAPRPVNSPGGTRITKVHNDEGKLIFEEVTASCCHGGEAIPAGGFRGGGQDIPTGHQSGGYSGNPPTQQPAPAQPKAEDRSCEGYEKGGKMVLEAFKEGQKSMQGNSVPENKTPWVLIFLVIALTLIAASIYIHKDRQSLSDKTEEPQVETPTPEPSEDTYKQTDDGEYKDSNTEESVAENNIHPVEFVEPEPLQAETYGEYTSADADLTIAILSHFSGPEAHNFRYLKGDSLDGQNKFVMTAVQVAALMKSGKGVRWKKDEQGNEKWEIYPASYSSLNQNSEAARMARLIGEKTEYHSVYQNDTSFHWVVNNAVEEVPSSSETDYSKAVTRTLRTLMEEVKERKIPSINGKVFFVSNDATGNTKSIKSASGKSMSNTKIGMVTVDISPLPNGIKKIGRGVKLHGDVHHGHDLAAECGDPVAAVKGGKVIKDAFSDSYGNLVAIYDGTYVWQYAHLKKRSHKSYGSNVKAGERIAFVGNTGHTEGPTGCHLHLECWTLAEWNKKEKDQKAQPNQLKLTAEVQIGPRLFAFLNILLR